MAKINSLQLLGTVVDNYSMESLLNYYVAIQIEREKEDLKRIFLYEIESFVDEFGRDDMDYDNSDFDFDECEYLTEDDFREKYGFN